MVPGRYGGLGKKFRRWRQERFDRREGMEVEPFDATGPLKRGRV